MLFAFAAGDMQQAESIKNSHRQLQDLATLYNALKAEYDKVIQQQKASLKDEYGILHFKVDVAFRDPVYTALSDYDRTQLQNNPSALTSFNDALLMRNRYKNALHKAWNIPDSAEPVVHQALYALIDCGTIPERINKIHELSSNPQLKASEQQAVVQALFLPNGIIKDFAEYDRVQSFTMPTTILRFEHAQMRQLLNTLVYQERICSDERIKIECAAGIECIHKAVTTNNQETAAQYLAQVQSLYDRTVNPGITDVHGLNDAATHDVIDEIGSTCGTGQLKDKSLPTGSCLPELHKHPEHSLYPEQENGIEQGSCDTGMNEPDTQPKPCGFKGQTLPSFGSDETAVNEGENKEIGQENDDLGDAIGESSNDEMPVEEEVLIAEKEPSTGESIASNTEFIERASALLQDENLTAEERKLLKDFIEAYKNQELVNQESISVFKDGYYEVNGFKFTKIYYEKLWGKGGRRAPTLIAKDILANTIGVTPDREKIGFFRYECDGWELIYNPTTSEIWHLGPVKKVKK